MKYFRVKIGYGKDDFISIDETELSKALRCMVKGSIAIFTEGSIAGKLILSIRPDWNKVMGYNRNYELNEEDYREIGEKRQREYQDLMYREKMAIESSADKVLLN